MGQMQCWEHIASALQKADSDTVCPYIKQTLCWYCGCAALTQAKQLVIVVGSPDAVKIAVEAEKSDQCMSTLQQRITAVAIKAGAPADQKMLTFGSDEITLPAAEAEQPLPAANQQHVPLQVQQQPSVLQKHIEAQQAPPQQLPQHLSQQQPQQGPQQVPQQVHRQYQQQQRMNAYRHRQNMARQRQERPSVPEAPQETLYARSGYSQR